jgi:hypothetical protein
LVIKKSSALVSQSAKRRRTPLPGPGIVLECTGRGTLLKIRRDDLGVLKNINPGISFLHLLSRDSLDKAFLFLTELKKRTSAFGWELKVSLPPETTPLFVGGTLQDNRLLIFGTRTRGALLGFSRCFLDGNLRRAVNRAIREHTGLAPDQNERESALHEELHSANNKLINLQRVLAKKTASLKGVMAKLQLVQTGIPASQYLLPICSSCKKIRNEQGYWSQVETYFKEHAGLQFTHSICPECFKLLYPGLMVEK